MHSQQTGVVESSCAIKVDDSWGTRSTDDMRKKLLGRKIKYPIASLKVNTIFPHTYDFVIHYTIGDWCTDTPSVSLRTKVCEGRCDHISRQLFHITWLTLIFFFLFSSWKFTLKKLPWACGFLEGRFSLWQGHLLTPETSWWPQSDLCPCFGIWKQLHRILHQFSQFFHTSPSLMNKFLKWIFT